MKPQDFQSAILKFYQEFGRKDLPWQQNKTSYRVWISEIMLQQTQVATVIPYYQRFMERFPDLESLAAAPQDDVLALWSGLGYYSRARNLHKCAQTLINDHQGQWPDNVEAMESLPGIGRSTAGAILSLAQNIRAPILDGNVKRVLCRFYTVEGWPGQTSVAKKLWQIAEEQTPQKQVAEFNQAMMDMGATVCTRSKPKCTSCPLQSHCQALSKQVQSNYPNSKPKKEKPTKEQRFAVIKVGNKVLLEKRPAPGIWGGLWCLPEIPEQVDDDAVWIQSQWKGKLAEQHEIEPFRHTFSHYHLILKPALMTLTKQPTQVMDSDHVRWQDLSQIEQLGLPAPIAKLLKQLEQESYVQESLL
ncbi:A/G-specific adenine glycosylase [Pleionea sp. CnH1-48]|uniref:A/G-specific adenine glycosylase n=1 Tax=Pleionea sp. CnH1-48 TaxID=2954494 RepID=UPI0020972C21|nr:A/G-specific adenine glycosylase [Pleionea sp. CnH1-48]MCO7227115.1 A/G-specific adenine glycosylase [Pleionea sp. CnH1-48]